MASGYPIGDRNGNVIIRELGRQEVEQIWTIDRSEVIDGIYYLEGGQLVLKPEHYDMRGWPPGEPEKYTPILHDCFDRGGTFYGAFEGSDLVGVVRQTSRPRPANQASFAPQRGQTNPSGQRSRIK